MMKRLLVLATLFAAPGAATAQEAPALGFGAALTSNYVFRGTTQSENRPALQAYAEAAFGGFYLGAWGSTVRIDEDRAELDLYAGFRGTIGALSYDFGYVRYLYDSTGDCCGEAFIALDHPIGAVASFGVSFFRDFGFHTDWAELRGEATVAGLWTVSGALGTDFGSLDLPDNKVAWNLGVTRSLGTVSLDARYHDSNEDPGRGVLTLSIDF